MNGLCLLMTSFAMNCNSKSFVLVLDFEQNKKMANMEVSRKLVLKIGFLFAVGVFFALLLDASRLQRRSKLKVEPRYTYSTWWILVLCGTAATIVGLLYPRLHIKIGERQIDAEELPKVMRCVAAFVGINQATTKIHFSSNLQLAVALAVLSISLWWAFDGTRGGFEIGISSAIVAIFITQFVMYHQLCKVTERELLYVRSWLPCVVFSGGITVGNIGRQLALIESNKTTMKIHQE